MNYDELKQKSIENSAKKYEFSIAYKTLVGTTEWKALDKIFNDMYSEAFDILRKEENCKARVKLEVIEEIYEKINGGIKIGDKAKEEYLKKINIK